MDIIRNIPDLRIYRKKINPNFRIGLVPTMGALHEGHATLAQASVKENDLTIVSIFVNPTQFGPNEDFERYPRDLEKDARMLAGLGVDAIFAPSTQEVYPAKAQFYFDIKDLDQKLCGASRPGHMNGVVQVVSILFHLVQPTHAYFGLKDYQQCRIIQTLVEELHFPLEVVPCPIIREEDGLAMSSRNVYLNREEREQALFLSQTLNAIQARRSEFSSINEIQNFALKELDKFPLVKLDYFEVLNGKTLEDLSSLDPSFQPHLFIAAYLGKTRLIDNMAFGD
ncbi:MAG: pantoate--beta-alanine ligase [Bacteroidetes bacterium]|nr:pantoate--beta-alanine ligase [Bacteroidota bacterium]MCB0844492.1 pantoate--beta-alanine ligase [Bacteroidota bacterium]